LKKDVILRRIN